VQKSLLRGAEWAEKGSGDAITGYILLSMIILMAGTALHRGNGSKGYKIFSNTHFLYSFWLIVLCLHVPSLWPWFFAIGLLFTLERAYDFFKQTTHSTLSNSRPCGKNITFLSVPRSSLPSHPGSYFRIKVSDISRVEWHPFSLAGSVSSHHLTFFVASTGDWTKKLFEIVSDPARRDKTSIQVL
jgi:predicted ferric reductase